MNVEFHGSDEPIYSREEIASILLKRINDGAAMEGDIHQDHKNDTAEYQVTPQDIDVLEKIIFGFENISSEEFNRVYSASLTSGRSNPVTNTLINIATPAQTFFSSEIIRNGYIKEYGNGDEAVARSKIKEMMVEELMR